MQNNNRPRPNSSYLLACSRVLARCTPLWCAAWAGGCSPPRAAHGGRCTARRGSAALGRRSRCTAGTAHLTLLHSHWGAAAWSYPTDMYKFVPALLGEWGKGWCWKICLSFGNARDFLGFCEVYQIGSSLIEVAVHWECTLSWWWFQFRLGPGSCIFCTLVSLMSSGWTKELQECWSIWLYQITTARRSWLVLLLL